MNVDQDRFSKKNLYMLKHSTPEIFVCALWWPADKALPHRAALPGREGSHRRARHPHLKVSVPPAAVSGGGGE